MIHLRAIVCGIGALLVGTAGVLACTAGEEIQYDSPGLSTDGGIPEGAIVDDSGRIIFESGVPVQERPEAATLPPPNPRPCVGLTTQDAGECDTTAGLGCCLDPNKAAECEEQVQYSAGAFCATPGALFVSCTSSIDDSLCCWQNDGPGGSLNTRYRASCDGGIEACDPSNGGVCANGGPCNATTCSKVPALSLGFCGAPPAGFACP